MTLAWYCVRTARHREVSVWAALGRLDFASYLPMQYERRGRGEDRRVVRRALIPRHLLVGVPEEGSRAAQLEAVRSTRYVADILTDGPGHEPQQVPWRQVCRIETAEAELAYAFHSKDARVVRQRQDDTDEFIAALKAASPDQRVEVLLSMLGRGRTARVRLGDLQQVA